MIRVAVGYRLGLRTCEPHTCPCGKDVHTRELHGLSCRRSSARKQRHAHLNYVIWRSITRAQIPVAKGPMGLSRTDGKRPDGATLIPWSRGKLLAWNVTVSNTFLESRLKDRSCSESGGNLQDHQIHVNNNNTHVSSYSN